MGTTTKDICLNTLALEAAVFLKRIDKIRDKPSLVDGSVLYIFDEILIRIDKLLERRSQEQLIKPNAKIKLPNLDAIQQHYRCFKCNGSFKTLQEAALHTLQNCKAAPQKKETKQIHSISKLTKNLLTYKNESEFLHKLRLAEKLQSLQEYDIIRNDIMQALKISFPNRTIKVHFFGSRITGIASRISDIDAFVEIDNNFRFFEESASYPTHEKLRNSYEALQKTGQWSQLLQFHRARIPILRAFHVPTGIKCDIGFTNGLSTVNTNLLEYLFDLQPLARCLCLHIKEWMLLTNIKSVMSSYCMVLMVVFFLQTKNLLPSVQLLQEKLDLKQALRIGPWLATFNCYSLNELGISKLPVTLSCCKEYLKMFYNYYVKFDFKSCMICPYLGQETKIANYKAVMPEWYNSYTKQRETLSLNTVNKNLVLQDPFQLNFNVGRNINLETLAMILEYMALSQAVL